jgi:lactoylglutathione lyase
MIAILKFEHIALPIKDLSKSIHFYHTLLGLEFLPRPDFDFEGAWFDLGNGIQLHLLKSEVSHIMSGSRLFHFAFKVEDVKEIEDLCIEHNLLFNPIKTRSDGIRQIFVQDPDGWYLEFNSL